MSHSKPSIVRTVLGGCAVVGLSQVKIIVKSISQRDLAKENQDRILKLSNEVGETHSQSTGSRLSSLIFC